MVVSVQKLVKEKKYFCFQINQGFLIFTQLIF